MPSCNRKKKAVSPEALSGPRIIYEIYLAYQPTYPLEDNPKSHEKQQAAALSPPFRIISNRNPHSQNSTMHRQTGQIDALREQGGILENDMVLSPETCYRKARPGPWASLVRLRNASGGRDLDKRAKTMRWRDGSHCRLPKRTMIRSEREFRRSTSLTVTDTLLRAARRPVWASLIREGLGRLGPDIQHNPLGTHPETLKWTIPRWMDN